MAAYFDFEKKHPHVNVDDVFVISGNVKNDFLILDYSVKDYNPLSISLSSFVIDKFDFINNVKFVDNKMVFSYNSESIADLSIDLSCLDKHVNGFLFSEDKKEMSVMFNDNSNIVVDMSKYAENYYISSWSKIGNNLVLKYNEQFLNPIVIDLEKINNKLVGASLNDSILCLSDMFDGIVSVDLQKFSYNDFIESYSIDNANQLILRYTKNYASGNAKDLSIDLAKFAKNYYIEKTKLCNETIVFDYNTREAGENLSVNISTINNYIANVTIIDKTLVLSYNSDRIQPLSINIENFIKDYYIKDVKLCGDNKLHFKYNYDDPSLYIEPVDLSGLNDHIVDIKHDLNNDTVQFVCANEKSLPVLNLTKYVNNDIDSIYINGNSLILKFTNGSTKDVALDKFDKYIENYQTDTNNLSLIYNNNKGCIVIDKQQLTNNLVSAYIENDIFYFDFKDSERQLTVDLKDQHKHIVSGKLIDSNIQLEYSNNSTPVSIDASKLSTYVDSIELNNAMLKLSYNANHSPITVSLNDLNNELTNVIRTENVLVCYFKNGKTYPIDLSYFNKYINRLYIDNNILKLVDNREYELTVSLDQYDKYIKSAYVDKDSKQLEFYYNNENKAFDVDIHDLNYELTSGNIDTTNNNLILKFTNDKSDISVNLDGIKTTDTYISSANLDSNDILNFDYNRAMPFALAVSLHKFARNDYIDSGKFVKDENKLVLNYRKQDGFETLIKPISIDFDVGFNFNFLSDEQFHATGEKKVNRMAQLLEKIVTVFGGNLEPEP